MWFQSVGTPMTRHAGGAHAELCGHGSSTPMGGRFRFALGGQFHEACNVNCHWRRPAGQVALNASQPVLLIALSPARDLNASNGQHLGNILVLNPSAASSTIPARCSNLTLVSLERTSFISSTRSSFVRSISVATRIHFLQSGSQQTVRALSLIQ